MKSKTDFEKALDKKITNSKPLTINSTIWMYSLFAVFPFLAHFYPSAEFMAQFSLCVMIFMFVASAGMAGLMFTQVKDLPANILKKAANHDHKNHSPRVKLMAKLIAIVFVIGMFFLGYPVYAIIIGLLVTVLNVVLEETRKVYLKA